LGHYRNSSSLTLKVGNCLHPQHKGLNNPYSNKLQRNYKKKKKKKTKKKQKQKKNKTKQKKKQIKMQKKHKTSRHQHWWRRSNNCVCGAHEEK
jgi:hypothetical protein